MGAATRASRDHAVVPAPTATAMIRTGHRVGWPQVYGSPPASPAGRAADQAARVRPLMAPDQRCARAGTGHDNSARSLDRLRRTAEQQATTTAGAR